MRGNATTEPGGQGDEWGDERDWGTSRQVIAVGALTLMIVALAVVALKGGDSRARIPPEPSEVLGETASRPVAVPPVIGRSQLQAVAILQKSGYVAVVTVSRPDETVPQGLIANQVPKAGTKLRRGSKVQLAISLGPNRATVPQLDGRSVYDALILLADAHLGYTATTEPSDRPVGTVLRSNPPAGSPITPGTSVALVLSGGNGIPPDLSLLLADAQPTGPTYQWIPAPDTGGQPYVPPANTSPPMSGTPTTRPPATRPPQTAPPTTRPPQTAPPTTKPPFRPPVTQTDDTVCDLRYPPGGGAPYEVCY